MQGQLTDQACLEQLEQTANQVIYHMALQQEENEKQMKIAHDIVREKNTSLNAKRDKRSDLSYHHKHTVSPCPLNYFAVGAGFTCGFIMAYIVHFLFRIYGHYYQQRIRTYMTAVLQVAYSA